MTSTTADRRAADIADRYINLHGSESHLHSQAADEHASLGIALSLIDCALARLASHAKRYCVLAQTEDARIALVDARCELETERAALGRVAGRRDAA